MQSQRLDVDVQDCARYGAGGDLSVVVVGDGRRAPLTPTDELIDPYDEFVRFPGRSTGVDSKRGPLALLDRLPVVGGNVENRESHERYGTSGRVSMTRVRDPNGERVEHTLH